MAKRRLDKAKLHITRVGEKAGRWRFTSREVSGTIYEYDVVDDNFNSYKQWKFTVSVPERMFGRNYIEVRPKDPPTLKCWTGINESSINFRRGTMDGYESTAYIKVRPADVTAPGKTIHFVYGERDSLPPWMDQYYFRLKKTVCTTRGHDGKDQVAIVNIENYDEMIRLFFALRVWVLRIGYQIEQ